MMMDKNMEWLMRGVEQKTIAEWGPAFEKLGGRLRRALLAERVLLLASEQDDSVGDHIVRRIVDEGLSWAIEKANA